MISARPSESFPSQVAIVIQLLSIITLSYSDVSRHRDVNGVSKLNTKTRSFQSPSFRLSELRNKCSIAERNLDKCSAQLVAFGLDTPFYPGSEKELDTIYCPKFKKLVACIKDNMSCYKPFERQIINWILTSTRRINFRRCKVEREKEKFLRLTNSCFPMMKPPSGRCMKMYIARLESIADYYKFTNKLSANDIQIQLSCCANKRFKQCILDNAKQQCKPFEEISKFRRTNSVSSQSVAHKRVQRMMRDTMEDLKSTIDGMSLTGPEFICRNTSEDFCRQRFDGRFDGHKVEHRSIVPAMLRIYSNM